MSFLKIADKIAVAAMFAVIGGVPLAVSAAYLSGPGAQAKQVQLLKEDGAQSIRPGMTADQVLLGIGAPYAKVRFEATKTTAWDYRYRDAWGYDADFSVIFDDNGRVVSKISVRNGN